MRITEDLLRKKAEHNEGRLANLEELALHQLDIERIENFDKLCRHIQILLLQNNIIEKLENLNKLKELTYINLALNNIKKIENLEGCESLMKIDLTANFIDIEDWEESCENLKKVPQIAEIYLTGNPVQDWKGWKDFLIAVVDQIKYVDGKEILNSERILAKQSYKDLLEDLRVKVEMKRVEELANPKENNENAYTRENRKKMYQEQEKERLEKEKKDHPEKFQEKKITPTHYPNGEPRVCNEGKYEFKLDEWEDPEYSFFELKIPKHMDTSLIDASVHPKLVSVRVKDKLTQMKLFEEVSIEKSEIKRSQVTGILHIKMPKANPSKDLVSLKKKRENEEKAKKAEEEKQKKFEEEKTKEEESKRNKDLIERGAKKMAEIDYTLDDIPDLE